MDDIWSNLDNPEGYGHSTSSVFNPHMPLLTFVIILNIETKFYHIIPEKPGRTY